MTVTTIHGTTDGEIDSNSTTYSLARSGTALSVVSSPGYISVGQVRAGSARYCLEGFVLFDTSGIPDTDVVSDVVLSLWGIADHSTTNFTITAAQKTYSAGGLTTADWVAGASLTGQTLLATFDTAGYATGAYNDFTSDAGFPAQINKTGNTEIILYSSRHSGNNDPSGDEYIDFEESEATGTTNDPKLVVTHAAGGGVPIAAKSYHYHIAGGVR